jgi:D-proline dehydrogenase
VKVGVVGAGIAGLFAAYYLRKAGAEVSLFDERGAGDRSVHAAGIIEPTTAYPTSTFAFLRRVWRYSWSRTCVVRSVDPRWLVESLRAIERPPVASAAAVMRRMGDRSFATYAALSEGPNDFEFSRKGLIERFDDPRHFAEQRDHALAHRAEAPVEVSERPDGAGSLFFPEVGWLHTERFVARLLPELAGTEWVRERARSVSTEGEVETASGRHRFDAVAVCAGTAARKLGVPLTGVRGFGWHVTSSSPVEVATIHVDRGIAIVPFSGELKVTGGWDFDLSADRRHADAVLRAIREVLPIDSVLGFNDGSRPCTPDGLPTAGRRDRLVFANGGFRLGWTFAPALGEAAADLCLGRSTNDPFLARFCEGLRSGPLA